jgi:hypothetical protein
VDNTAVSDMERFIAYLDSPDGQDAQDLAALTIIQYGDIRDVSQLLDNIAYDCRALAELDVTFVLGEPGRSGNAGTTSSGGGGKEEETGWFDRVETIEKEG